LAVSTLVFLPAAVRKLLLQPPYSKNNYSTTRAGPAGHLFDDDAGIMSNFPSKAEQ